MVKPKEPSEFSDEEITRRRDDAIRRALITPPKPLKEYVGKSERAVEMKESRARKAARSKKEAP
jgi:hypothetical protein